MAKRDVAPDVKKGSAELLVLALVEDRARHGYEIGKLIDDRSGGVLKFHIASLYPMLYRLERRGLIAGRWVEKAGQRRRRYYRITAEGRRVLASHRTRWRASSSPPCHVIGDRHADRPACRRPRSVGASRPAGGALYGHRRIVLVTIVVVSEPAR